MKKALVILFALGLVFSFSAPVMATDVSVDGSFRIRGWYDSNANLLEEGPGTSGNAYYDQRLRVGVVFQVAEGLKVVTRCDILDTIWGRSDIARSDATLSQDNVQFDKAYMSFMTGIGQVEAGWMSDGNWGLGFGNLESFVGKINFTTKLGDLILNLNTVKNVEGDRGHNLADRDYDSYRAAVIYAAEGVTAGLLYVYDRNAFDPGAPMGIPSSVGLVQTAHLLEPYFKLTMGDLYVEGEFGWLKGEVDMEPLGVDDIDLEGLRAYLMAKYNLGPAYVGALAVYVQGDDPDSDEIENGLDSGGDWQPCLILFNDGTCPAALGTFATTGNVMDNGFLYQVFAGTAMDKLSVKASLTYAYADETPTGFDSDDYGTEIDVEAAYKIYDNLTYSVGLGYLFAGDYYKGTDSDNPLDDTYLLMNKLQVKF